MATDDLALRRTLLASERTLLAWVRTSTSLTSFGFTIYKFFQYLVETNFAERPPKPLLGPRAFALCMIGVGVSALAVATIDYRRTFKVLEKEHGMKYPSMAGKLAGLLFFLGLGLLIVVLLRG